ncbi:MAG TPA: hypothetical protein VFX58_03805 [Chitinophagaceae bacterium]|nr:hypothetical protein [Chitinophagaceae bacterium]
MANRPITITGINPADNSLILSDNGTTVANPGDTVTWLIGQNSGVASITGITDNSTPTDVFNPDPAPVASSSNWQGTINPGINAATEEYYTINYTKTSTEGSFKFDPKIQVNP